MTTIDESTPPTTDADTTDGILGQIQVVRDGFAAGVLADADQRRRQLEGIARFLTELEHEIGHALRDDLGKSPIEAYTTEIGYVKNEVANTLKHLKRWMRPERVSVPIHLQPGTARVHREPLGTVLVIAPWNYPVQLTLAPLVAAVAAGNTAVLKPSEIAPATSDLLAQRLNDYVDPSVVQVVTGAVPETTLLLRQRFDHIFYTGNGTVGKIVMRAAAEHLTPVTLELGGKSPAIVAASADVEIAARRIAWGKFINAGQTCVAPDYVLVDESIADEFVAEVPRAIESMWGPDPVHSHYFGRIVNERHFDRLTALLDAGGYEHAVFEGANERANRYFAPTILSGVSPDAAVMNDEIFGPILPILTYSGIDEAIGFVNARPKPLALYLFSGTDSTIDRVLERTSSGGVTVNHTLLHLAVHGFPFGGVGPSGMGSYHGEDGFITFSHRKPVLRRTQRPDPKLAYPPYSDLEQKIMHKLF